MGANPEFVKNNTAKFFDRNLEAFELIALCYRLAIFSTSFKCVVVFQTIMVYRISADNL